MSSPCLGSLTPAVTVNVRSSNLFVIDGLLFDWGVAGTPARRGSEQRSVSEGKTFPFLHKYCRKFSKKEEFTG
jgi:hypothetical protein